MRDAPSRPGRGSRALWIAAAIAIFVLLLWWAARAFQARDAVPADAPGAPTSHAPGDADPERTAPPFAA